MTRWRWRSKPKCRAVGGKPVSEAATALQRIQERLVKAHEPYAMPRPRVSSRT
jgi:hypothetical protein